MTSDEDIYSLHNSHNEIWRQSWSVLNRVPELYGLTSNPAVLEAVKATGIERPVLTQPPFIRADMKSDEQRQGLGLHQDYPSGLGSNNSVTVWIPFQSISESIGALQVAHGSHQDFEIVPVEELPQKYPSEALTNVLMTLGEILVFSQHLVHRSGYNHSDEVRFTAQLRYADMADVEFSRRGYPFNFDLRPVNLQNTGLKTPK